MYKLLHLLIQIYFLVFSSRYINSHLLRQGFVYLLYFRLTFSMILRISMNKLMMSRQSSIVATMYSSGDTRFMIIWVSNTINPEIQNTHITKMTHNILSFPLLIFFFTQLTNYVSLHYIPEKRSAPKIDINVSVNSPPTKICMKPPSIKIQSPAKSLEIK